MSERYIRNTIIEQIGQEGQKTLLASNVLVAGAGGLASGVIANLVSVGVGNINIVDNDVIELSNLNRQYIHRFANLGKYKTDSAKQWIFDFNPDININTYRIRLDEDNYKEAISGIDLIIDCFDSYKSKFLLNKIAVINKIPLIHGGVTEFYGQVTVVISEETACLNCLFPDVEVDKYEIKGVISPAVSAIASIQSMEAVKLLLNIGNPLKNRLLTYNGLDVEFKQINIAKNPACPACGK